MCNYFPQICSCSCISHLRRLRMIPGLFFSYNLCKQLVTNFHRLDLRRSVCFPLCPVRPLSFRILITTLSLINTTLTQANIPPNYPLCLRQIHIWACSMSFSDSMVLQDKGRLKSFTLCPSLLDSVHLSSPASCHCPVQILCTCCSDS